MVSGKSAMSIVSGILGIFVVIGVVFGAHYLIQYGAEMGWGVQPVETEIVYSGTAILSAVGGILNFFMGDLANTTQGLLLSIGFFMIMMFAVSDILKATSTFSGVASWGIAAGLGLVAAGAGVVEGFYDLLLQGAAITAFSIFVLILTLICIFMVVHVFWGSLIVKARIDKKVTEIEEGGSVIGAVYEGTRKKIAKGMGLTP